MERFKDALTRAKQTRETISNYARHSSALCYKHDTIDDALFNRCHVFRGLRDKQGHGVVTGITNISRVDGRKVVDGKEVACDGRLLYRGYNVIDLVRNCISSGGFGFEEVAYLLLFGALPDKWQLEEFRSILCDCRRLPEDFTRDVIMKGATSDLMNSMAKSVLSLASYDPSAMDISVPNVLRQCLQLISVFPLLAIYGYQSYNHYLCDDSLYIHRPDPQLSTAENMLRLLRPDCSYTETEAHVLDAALILHMEHGGGNNSTFTTRVVTSAGSDTYSVMAAALTSLKGPKHGGANIKVMEMMKDLKESVKDTTNETQVRDYLAKLLDGKAFDHKGLIYGLGHAIYAVSDPRAEVFRGYVQKLAEEKGRMEDFALYSNIERMAPELINERRKIYKGVCVNVDFYSGFVYSMLDIPVELYTPIFAVARSVGWSAHRLEELVNMDKIIRPAYESVIEDERAYVPLEKR